MDLSSIFASTIMRKKHSDRRYSLTILSAYFLSKKVLLIITTLNHIK